jgi:hypothetical protein
MYSMVEQQQRKNATAGEAKEQNRRVDQSRASHPCHDSHASYGLACSVYSVCIRSRTGRRPVPEGKKRESIYISRAVRVSQKEPAAIAGEEGNQVYLKQDGQLCSVLSELAAP